MLYGFWNYKCLLSSYCKIIKYAGVLSKQIIFWCELHFSVAKVIWQFKLHCVIKLSCLEWHNCSPTVNNTHAIHTTERIQCLFNIKALVFWISLQCLASCDGSDLQIQGELTECCNFPYWPFIISLSRREKILVVLAWQEESRLECNFLHH